MTKIIFDTASYNLHYSAPILTKSYICNLIQIVQMIKKASTPLTKDKVTKYTYHANKPNPDRHMPSKQSLSRNTSSSKITVVPSTTETLKHNPESA